MSEYLILLKRELKSIIKEKTILLAVMIQFFIASFAPIILVGIMAFYDPASIGESTRVSVTVGIVGDKSVPLSGYLTDRNITVKSFFVLSTAKEAFRSGQIDAILFIPESRSGLVEMKLILPKSDTKKTTLLMMLDEPLKRYENYLREANGVRLNYKDTASKPHATYEFLYSVIIPILMLFPALIAGSVVIDILSEELENKTFDTLMSAPVSLGQVLASKVSAAIVTAAVQIVMWAGLLRLNGFTMQRPILVLLLAVIISALISFGAALLAMSFKSRERAQFVYSIILIVSVSASYFFDLSPVSYITKLATGTANIDILGVMLYIALVTLIGIMSFKASKKLMLARQ